MQDYLKLVFTHLRGMWRFRWPALGLAWALAVIGWVWVYSLPSIYGATARVYVNTELALKPLLNGLAIDADVMSQASMMTHALLTQPHLERIARETGLDADVETRQDHEKLLESLRKKIVVFQDSDQSIFTLGYTHTSRSKAEAVVDALLRSFVGDSLDAKREDSSNAQSFLEGQIAEYARRLDEAEQELVVFKRDNAGLMSGGSGDHYSRFQAAMAKRNEINARLDLAVERRDEILRQLESEQPVSGDMAYTDSEASIDAQLRTLRAQLVALRVKYTDRHPEIVRLIEIIAQLEAQQRIEAPVAADSRLLAAIDPAVPVHQRMRMELSMTALEIVDLKAQAAGEQRTIDELQQLVDTAPQAEARLNRLNREYDSSKRQYEELVQRLETARLSDDAAQSTSGVKFKVIEPTLAPVDPVGPPRRLLLAMALFGAVSFGVLLAFMLNQLKPVFATATSLHEATGLPVLGILSLVGPPENSHRRRVAKSGLAAAAVCLLLSFGVVLAFAEPGAAAVQSLLNRDRQ